MYIKTMGVVHYGNAVQKESQRRILTTQTGQASGLKHVQVSVHTSYASCGTAVVVKSGSKKKRPLGFCEFSYI